MEKQFVFILILLFAFASCKKNDPVPDRDKFIGTYSGTQTVTVYINNQLFGSNTEAGTETIERGTFNDEIVIGKGSDTEVTAKVSQSAIAIPTQSVFVQMDDGTQANFSTSGNGLLSGANLTINFDMKSTVDGYIYHYVVKETLVKN